MIVVKLKGGMGNQMFQYALGRVLAVKNNTELVLDTRAYKKRFSFLKGPTPRTYDLDVFNISGKTTKNTSTKNSKKILQETELEKFKPELLEAGSDVYLDGYFQSPNYFTEYEDLIRKDFTLKKPLSLDMQKMAKEISQEGSLCVHVRRGDYVGNKFHEVVNNEYYQKGVEYISQKSKIEKIYVFSDDIEWCKQNMLFDFPTVFIDDSFAGEKGEGHIYLMSRSKNFVIANSTFSWWGAWLSGSKEKIVVCPKKWFGDESIDTGDLIPDSWVRI